MTGDVDVLGQYQLPRRLEPRSLPHQAAARAVHRRRRARAVGVRHLTRARSRPDRRGAAVSAARSAAGCSSTARSASAATRARCSKPARRASSASIAIATRSPRRATTLAPWADRVELVHADYRALDDVLDARGVDRDRRRARRSRRVVAAVRRAGPRLQLSARRAARHADGPQRRRHRRRSGRATPASASWPTRSYAYGEERFSRRIARAHRRGARARRRSTTTGRLAAIVRRAVPRRGYQRIDPATRTFQALRIWVNRELDGLDRFLERAVAAAARRRAAGRRSRFTRSRIAS